MTMFRMGKMLQQFHVDSTRTTSKLSGYAKTHLRSFQTVDTKLF